MIKQKSLSKSLVIIITDVGEDERYNDGAGPYFCIISLAISDPDAAVADPAVVVGGGDRNK